MNPYNPLGPIGDIIENHEDRLARYRPRKVELTCSNCGEPVKDESQEGAYFVTCSACAAAGDHTDTLVDEAQEDAYEDFR